ncbi:MAG: Re/Si-specific NAD(P)(+) transhydrogenase subunit alpha [Solirubrobacterales bacterium]
MRIGVVKETREGERRVALVPDAVKRLTDREGHEIVVEAGAGLGANHLDESYEQAGATLASDGSAWDAEVVLKVAAPTEQEIGRLSEGQVLVGFLSPLTDGDTAKALADAGVTAFAVEAIPRTTRAQAMDALSSQANIGGYAAVLLASTQLGRFFPMLTTAAGTIAPAKVLVLGAGVAGLQAIATAKRLGAVVTGFDVRGEVAEQVQSLGAKFLEIDVSGGEGEGGYARELDADQQELIKQGVSDAAVRSDVVITTAQIPGRPAPKLVSEQAVKDMNPGAIIVDLAGESGGNTDLTQGGKTVVEHDVKIVSELNLPSSMSQHASQLYAQNMVNLLALFTGDDEDDSTLRLDFTDDIVEAACLTHGGGVVHGRAAEAAGVEKAELPSSEPAGSASTSGEESE